MVAPRRRRHVDGRPLRQELGDEVQPHPHTARAADALGRCDAIADQSWRVGAEQQLACDFDELGVALDAQVLLVERLVSVDDGLCLAHHTEYERLALVAAVGAHSQVHLAGVLVGAIANARVEDLIGRGCQCKPQAERRNGGEWLKRPRVAEGQRCCELTVAVRECGMTDLL